MVENDKQNPDHADDVAADDAHKVEKLANAGEDTGAVEEAEKK